MPQSIGRFRRVSRRASRASTCAPARRIAHRQPKCALERRRRRASRRRRPQSLQRPCFLLPPPPRIRLGACAPSPDARSGSSALRPVTWRGRSAPLPSHFARTTAETSRATARASARFTAYECAGCASIRRRPTLSPCTRASPLAASPRIAIHSDARGSTVTGVGFPADPTDDTPGSVLRTTACGSMPAGDGRRCRRPLHLRA